MKLLLVITLMMTFEAFAQRVKENIKQQQGVTVSQPVKKPVKGK